MNNMYTAVDVWRQYGPYRLRIINRFNSPELIEATVRLAVFCIRHIEANKQVATWPANEPTTPELKLAAKMTDDESIRKVSGDHVTEPRVTVIDDRYGLIIHSHSEPQDVLDVYYAEQYTHDALNALYPPIIAQVVETPQTPPSASKTGNPDNPPPVPTGAIIKARLAPSPKKPQYQDGQLVEYLIKKISLGLSDKDGAIIYKLWSKNLGNGQYPLLSIFKTKPGSDENSANYQAVADLIVSLNLSIENRKTEANGDWRLVCQAAHVTKENQPTKEYMNVISMEAI